MTVARHKELLLLVEKDMTSKLAAGSEQGNDSMLPVGSRPSIRGSCGCR